MKASKLLLDIFDSSFKKNVKRFLRRYYGNILFHNKVVSQLRKEYTSHILNISKHLSTPSQCYDCKIWVMWWQGLDNMPDIIRICYNSILTNADGLDVILITEKNFEDFISIPEYILDKFKKGIIPIAQFSDIIRFSLLAQHGGLWLDATTLVTNFKLTKLNNRFFTHKFKTNSQSTPTTGRWSITIMSGPANCHFFYLMKELLYAYWLKENVLKEYFLTDYFILLLYKDVIEIKQLLDKVEWSKSNYLLRDFINEPYCKEKWESFSNQVHFHTLTRKASYHKLNNWHQTFYGYLLHNI